MTDTVPESPCEDTDCNIAWSSGESLPTPTDHHTTALVEDGEDRWLVVAGGKVTSNQRTTERNGSIWATKIQDDGSLAGWENLQRNPFNFSHHAQAHLPDGGLLFVGGLFTDEQDRVRPLALVRSVDIVDGEHTAENGTVFEEPIVHATAHVVAGEVIVLGGFAGRNLVSPVDRVQISPLVSDGINGEWSLGPALPNPRALHTSIVYDGHIYVFGGFNDQETEVSSILRSTHDEDGTVSGWEEVGNWEHARWTATTFVHNGSAYLLGGGVGEPATPEIVDTVSRIELTEDGIGEIETVEQPLPTPRSHVHQAPVLNHKVYSVGGQSGSLPDSIDSVFVGQLPQ